MYDDDMGGLPLVSVIIPTHNRRGYLAESLDSVRAQTHSNWEIVVVDDASEDGTGEWLKTQQDERLRAVTLENNSGSTITRNTGLAMANGEYCVFLDDDDLLPADALALHLDALAAHPKAIGTVGCVISFDENGVLDRGKIQPTPFRKLQHHVWRDVQFWWPYPVTASMFRTSVVQQIGGFNEELVFYGDDTDLWMRLSDLGPVVLMPDNVIRWRFHGQQRPKDFYDFQTKIGEDFKESWSSERRAATEKVLAARAALYDLRLRSGTNGNWLRVARLFARFAVYPWLLSSPMVWGEVLRALERDVKMDPWLRPVKRVLGRA
jgi:glycosyltransferase involved in cell wall biosynthesis